MTTQGIFPACEGITNDQITNFTANGFNGFSAACINSIRSDTFRSVGVQQIKDLSLPAIPGNSLIFLPSFLPFQPSIFPVASTTTNHNNNTKTIIIIILIIIDDYVWVIIGLRGSQVAAIPGPSAAGFSSEQITLLSSNDAFSACSGISGAHLTNIPVESYPGFTSLCLAKITPPSFGGVGGEQLNAFNVSAMAGT